MATTMGASPVMVVNGPIRERIGMNMKIGALGQGNRANASIGRAVRLAIRNIGGAKPGGTERSTLGNPMKITMCFAEWEERSPWTPLHVERGFKPTDSVVTVYAMSGGPIADRRPDVAQRCATRRQHRDVSRVDSPSEGTHDVRHAAGGEPGARRHAHDHRQLFEGRSASRDPESDQSPLT